ncbi:MAG: nickel-type superoxide dismutase maturation protease [Acidobacteriota bacterium]|nr:nickel-type superoxide dismutase maturation protease [Acidobacteriota bacterium]
MRDEFLSRLVAHLFYLMEKLPKVSWLDIFLLLVGRRKRFCVEGNSMLPTLKNGDVVLVNPQAKLKQGDIVLANHPYKKSVKILKRIKEFTDNGDLFLIGDNAGDSTDSRTFGAVSLKYIIGKVTCHLSK